MLIKYHDLETYYLNRRLELLKRLDSFAEQSLHDEDFEMNDLYPAIELLREQYDDVIDPESLCETIKTIYPDDLIRIEKRYTKQKGRI